MRTRKKVEGKKNGKKKGRKRKRRKTYTRIERERGKRMETLESGETDGGNWRFEPVKFA